MKTRTGPPINFPILAITSISLLAILLGSNPSIGEDFIPAKVLSVIDGDTIVVRSDGKKRKVRLLGIDCPEISKKREHDDFMAQEAKNYLETLIKGEMVRLEFDFEKEDRYGRWLCYVFREKGEMVNEMLVKAGFALTIQYFPFREKGKFTELQREAEREGRGLFHNGSRDAVQHTTRYNEPVMVYPGPSKTYTIVYQNMAKTWLNEGHIAEEIARIRRYERKYAEPLLHTALRTDGYVPFENAGKGEKTKGIEEIKINYRDAKAYIGRFVTVAGEVVRTNNTGRVIYLDFDRDWKNNLSIVIFAKDASKFPVPPEDLYHGKEIEVKGKIKLFKGKPEIVIKDPRNIVVHHHP